MTSSKLSVWVHVFLWGAVGISLLQTALNLLNAIALCDQTPFYLTMRLLAGLTYIAVGIYTIVAFYAHRPNALALMWTLFSMLVLNLIGCIVMICFEYDGHLLHSIISSVIWFIFWGTLMLLNPQIMELYPKEERRWFLPERVLLTIYVLSFCIYIVGACTAIRKPLDNGFYTADKQAQLALLKLQKSSPKYTHSLSYDAYALAGDTVCCDTHYASLSAAKTDRSMLPAYCEAERQRALWHYAHLRYRGQEKAYDFFNRHGFYLKTVLRDKDKRLIGTFIVSPEEYASAHEAGKQFRCDSDAWQMIIDCENHRLPQPMMALFTLQRIYLDDSYLCYEIIMPDYEPWMEGHFSEETMEGLIKKALIGLDGPCFIMADIDGRDLLFRALYRSGKEHTRCVISNEHIHGLHHMFE